MARYDDLKTGTIAYATFISAVLLLVIVLLLQALTFSWIEGEEVRKLTEGHYTGCGRENHSPESAVGSVCRGRSRNSTASYN